MKKVAFFAVFFEEKAAFFAAFLEAFFEAALDFREKATAAEESIRFQAFVITQQALMPESGSR